MLWGTRLLLPAGGRRQGLRAQRQEGAAPHPRTLSADSLACLKSCVSLTLGPVRPSADQFHKYLPWFLSDPPNIKCPKG